MKIGIIGCGNMGQAILERLRAEHEVWVFDKDKNKTKELKGVKLASNNADLTQKNEVIIFAVKPQDFDWVLREIKGKVQDKLIISIAAGISAAHIEKALGAVRVIRVMPNIAARIGESVSCLAKGANASESDLELAGQLFYSLGTVRVVEEKMMNAVTAISGSGPGYVFDFMAQESINPQNFPQHLRHELMMRLERAARSIGFNHEDAAFLAANTVNSSINLIQKLNSPAGELAQQVASKGGTTEAGLEVLHKGGTWEEAAQAALRRAEKLARG
ncbi:MAG: pyrroline-5-carboxylate reductase [Candidatus Omnitrophota bacterium]